MHLFLLRHGPAESPGAFASDNERPLSAEGRALVAAVAPAITHLTGAVVEIMTSPLHRARETAAIVCGSYGREVPIRITELLTPDTPLRQALSLLDSCDARRSYLLVSHQPLISAMAGTLIGAPPTAINFEPGTLVHLELFGAGNAGILHGCYPPHPVVSI